MNLFTRNSPYYHLLKYLLFLLKHRVYVEEKPYAVHSVVSIETRLGAERSGVKIPAETRGGVLLQISRPSLEPIHLPIQCVQWYSLRGARLTTRLFLTSRLRMSGAVPPLLLYFIVVPIGTTFFTLSSAME
jgi:hypothetical protein